MLSWMVTQDMFDCFCSEVNLIIIYSMVDNCYLFLFWLLINMKMVCKGCLHHLFILLFQGQLKNFHVCMFFKQS